MAVSYAIISLASKGNPSEAEQALLALQQMGKIDLAKWLDQNRARIYGKNRACEGWSPFGGASIVDIIERDSKHYRCDTGVIRTIKPDLSNLASLNHIKFFFVDAFAMLLPRFRDLAQRLDTACQDGNKHKCCFWLWYKMPPSIQDDLFTVYSKCWPSVALGYVHGKSHRIVAREEDLLNFKEVEAARSGETPDSDNIKRLNKVEPAEGPLPRL